MSLSQDCIWPSFKHKGQVENGWWGQICQTEINFHCCTGSVWYEITFFTHCIFLCLGFLTKARLATHHCFNCCWAVFSMSKLLLFLTLPPCSDQPGVGQRLGGTQLGQLTQTNQSLVFLTTQYLMLSNKNWTECVGCLLSQLLLGDRQGIILVVGYGNWICIT